MKRKHIKNQYTVGHHTPLLFWTRCFSCKKDFKWERMNKVWSGMEYHSGFYTPYYICKHCCPTDDQVRKYLAELPTWHWRRE